MKGEPKRKALGRGLDSLIPSAPTGLDPAETFGKSLYVRGSFDGWANPPPESQSFVNRGAAQYQAMTELGAGNQEFKIAAADWSVEFANVDEPTRLGVPITDQ